MQTNYDKLLFVNPKNIDHTNIYLIDTISGVT